MTINTHTTIFGSLLLDVTLTGDNRIKEIRFIKKQNSGDRVIPDRSQCKDFPSSLLADIYFSDNPVSYWDSFDLSGYSDFYLAVYKTLLAVPKGDVVSYGDLARQCGAPKAARAVGGAMAANRIPLLIPCHRVVQSTGAIGHYSGGLNVKSQLLLDEGVSLINGIVR